MKRVFITGMAGFIGFHTAMKFHNEGWQVCGIDNFNKYYDPQLKKDRAIWLSEQHGIQVEPCDIRAYSDIESKISKYKPDLVIHLAAMAGVRYSMDEPQEYFDNNITGTQNLIMAMEAHGINDVIYASTSSLMQGNPLPWDEVETFHRATSPYAASKMVNETQFHISDIPQAVGLRFFTVYGPYGRPDMALFDFTKSICAGDPITLYNYGKMKRDFTYIDDVVQGIWVVANNMTDRNMYCLGNGEQVELERFVDIIEQAVGIPAIRKYADMHPADAPENWSDTTKIRELGYKPTVPIEVGVRNFIQWYNSYHEDNRI